MQKMELNVHEEGAGLDKEMRSNGFLLDNLFSSHFDNKMRRGDVEGAVFAENSKRSEKGVGGLNDRGVAGEDFSKERSSTVAMFTRTSIHKANLRKKTDFKTDSFSRLFTDVLFGVFSRLPDFYENRSFYNNTERHWGGGGSVENVNYEPRIKKMKHET